MKPVVLLILDGWGLAPPGPGNAISLAKTPNLTKYWSAFPHTKLTASGQEVGLPRNEDGNSETGHLNLGAGHIVFQDLPRIDLSIADGKFFKNEAMKSAFDHTKTNHSTLHLMGLIGSGGVHSSLEHLLALIRMAQEAKVGNLALHLFTDGRDSPPTSALNSIAEIDKMAKIVSICGRYFAMDRDNRWERTQVAYEALTMGKGKLTDSISQTINESYAQGITDEFLEPIILKDKNGRPSDLIKDNDAVIFFNFRIDRPRQLTKAFVLPNFEADGYQKPVFDPYAERYGQKQYQVAQGAPFKRVKILKNLFFVTMTEYEKGLPVQVAFPPEFIPLPLARVLSDNNLRQLHLSETEKERFVGYYFDGQREDAFAGEDRVEIPSPRVKTYDLVPQMAAREVTEELIKRLTADNYDFAVVNLANPDMVGHTGVLEAGIKACEVVDECVGKMASRILASDGCLLITADHGNVEEMINLQTGEADTEHSTNPVPLIAVAKDFVGDARTLSSGVLADIAPTVLALLGLPKPTTMTGKNLLE